MAEINSNTNCTQCGDCCRNHGFVPTKGSDRKRWGKEGRDDILKAIGKLRRIHFPETLRHCPFLVDNKCSIQETKPYICKTWPRTLKSQEEFDCKGGLYG